MRATASISLNIINAYIKISTHGDYQVIIRFRTFVLTDIIASAEFTPLKLIRDFNEESSKNYVTLTSVIFDTPPLFDET